MIDDTILDLPLINIKDNADRLYLCSQEPLNFNEATSQYAVAYKEGLTISSPLERALGGRRIIVSAILEGTIVKSDRATHFAIVDFGSSKILAMDLLSAPKDLLETNTFSLDAFSINSID